MTKILLSIAALTLIFGCGQSAVEIKQQRQSEHMAHFNVTDQEYAYCEDKKWYTPYNNEELVLQQCLQYFDSRRQNQ